MTVRSFGDKTQHDYIRRIETFAKFLGRSPDTATGDDIRRFQLAQVERGAQPPKTETQASALRFFFTSRPAAPTSPINWPARTIHGSCRGCLPRIRSPGCSRPRPVPVSKYKVALGIAYGAGLRGGEVVILRVADIDSDRMLIRVEMGKGRGIFYPGAQ